MVGSTMVRPDLTPEMIQAGADFIRALDTANVPVTAAFWLFHGEEPDWRLNIASPEVAQLGKREFYGKLVDHLRALNRPELNVSNVTAVSPAELIVSALRKVFKISGLASFRFTGNAINGVFIPDALIYRST
jgi:hypothetical protein